MNILAREIVRRRHILRISSGGKCIVIGEVVLREQAIDGLPKRIGIYLCRILVPIPRTQVLNYFSVILSPVNPRTGGDLTKWRGALAGRFAFVVLKATMSWSYRSYLDLRFYRVIIHGLQAVNTVLAHRLCSCECIHRIGNIRWSCRSVYSNCLVRNNEGDIVVCRLTLRSNFLCCPIPVG